MKEYQLRYNGGTSRLMLKEKKDLTAGMALKMTKPPIVNFKAGQLMPDINWEEYYVYLATNVITEAPWGINDVNAVRNLPFDPTFKHLCEILGNEFPVEGFLFPVAKLMFGEKLEMPDLPSQIESTLKPSSAESPSAR